MPVPTDEVLVVTPLVRVAVNVKFSLTSVKKSAVIGVLTNTYVEKAAMVAVVAFTQVTPLSVETCKLVAPAAPKSVPPPAAVPFANTRLNTVDTEDALLKETIKLAKPAD